MAYEAKLGENDGLVIPDVGSWAVEKYRIIGMYAEMFSTGMKNRWDERIYLDLYAGAGYSRIRGTEMVLQGSPSLALDTADRFNKYVFCEENAELFRALETRAKRKSPDANLAFILGDCNIRVSEILAQVPQGSKSHTVLTLCIVDPFDLGIKFSTLKRLATRYMDFLCLLAFHMDANRNVQNYLADRSTKVDELLGSRAWRRRWEAVSQTGKVFPHFLADEFSSAMATLGYEPQPFYAMRQVRSDSNVPLYHLALFSRHPKAYEFWQEVLKYSKDQIEMFD